MAQKSSVIVTGFGPYGDMPISAGMITKLMPDTLPADDWRNPSGQEIIILCKDKDWAVLPTSYKFLRRRLREMHAEHGGQVSLWIHLGQSSRNDWIACERRAYRQDFLSTWCPLSIDKHYYQHPDGEKKSIDDIGPNPWLAVPLGLHSEVPLDTTVEVARSVLKGHDALEVSTHDDGGSAGCGFMFYESMANCYANNRKRNVMFLHVPRHSDEKALNKSKDAVLAVIGGAIDALIKQEQDPEKLVPAMREFDHWIAPGV